ncbi:hypothetical protein [Aneurinibacillus danicus]|jgi:hypothetical protein|uniref:Uncharacterized protein n=1 Tax=Aneurinibacillus danicus TaxID=267746 RepID=A0A511VAR4_9BACL|nr:hypothetical protein [Aneurinibacillus danicus]GEN36027.1 hypothetical protein ADA01nite_34870 [Aneurinibacillus danicus]
MKKFLAVSLSAAVLLLPSVSLAENESVTNASNNKKSTVESVAKTSNDIYVEKKVYTAKNNKQLLESISKPQGIELEEGAVLESYTETTMFVKHEGNKTSLLTTGEAEKIKKNRGINSLKELSKNDEEKVKKLLREQANKSDTSNTMVTTAASTVYGQDTETISGITGSLYTYQLTGTSSYASRAQLYANWNGLTLIPNRSDSYKDFLTMAWSTSEPMYTESYSGSVTYTDYSSNPDRYYTQNISSNREIYSAGKISLFYNDTYQSSWVPTQASINVIINKKTKTNKEGFAEAHLAHTYQNTVVSPSITASWPAGITINYTPRDMVTVVPLGTRFLD